MSSKRTSSRQSHSAGHFQSTPEHKPLPKFLRDTEDSFSSVNRTGSTSVARATAAIGKVDNFLSNTKTALMDGAYGAHAVASSNGAYSAHAASSNTHGAYGSTNGSHMVPNYGSVEPGVLK